MISNQAGFLSVIWSTVEKDLIMKWRYRADLVGDLVSSVLFIGVFALFATSYVFEVLDASIEVTLLFFLTGFLLIVYDSVVLWTPLNSVTNDLYNGTLEYLYSSPNSRLGYFIGNIVAAAIISSVVTVPAIIFISLYFKLNGFAVIMMIVTLLAVLLVLIAFGTMFALLGVMFRQVSSIAGILSMLFQFMGGFLFPIQSLPKSIQLVSYFLPYTWGIDLIRYYTIPGWIPLLPVFTEWMLLLIMGIFLWATTLYLIRRVEKYAKKNGLHLI